MASILDCEDAMEPTTQIQSIFPDEQDIPPEFSLKEPIHQNQFLVDGNLHTHDGPSQEIYSPIFLKSNSGFSQKLIGTVPSLTEDESLVALQSAEQAYDHGRGPWPTMSVSERIERIRHFICLMEKKKDEIVNLLMWEICKSYKDSVKEFDRTVIYIKDTIDSLQDLDRVSSRFVIEQGIIGQIRRGPLGVVLCMGPFNYPLNETFTILIPALIMGNTVVMKPPKHGVLLHSPLLSALKESFPEGVVNTVYGAGRKIIPPLMSSGKVNVFGFIGSHKVAHSLKQLHPRLHRLRSVLGLDAKNPAIILPGADLDLTVKECILGCLSYNGQRCTALKILFVHKNVAELFLEKLSDAIGKLRMGMPWDEGVSITPLPEPGKTDYLSGLVEDAKRLGAEIVNPMGGEINHTFFYPTVLYPVTSQMKIYHEEQFGPVIPVVPFSNIETPIRYVEESNFGQQISIFGTDPEAIAKLIDPLVNQLSRVNINSQCQRGPDTFPFTGRKDSAEGTLSVSDALRAFSIRTLVGAKDGKMNKEILTKIVRDRYSKFLSTDFIL